MRNKEIKFKNKIKLLFFNKIIKLDFTNRIILLFIPFFLLTSCKENLGLENNLIKIDNTLEHQIDSIETGDFIGFSEYNYPDEDVKNFLIFKNKYGNNSNYIKFGKINLKGLTEIEYLNAELTIAKRDFNFDITNKVQDTTINNFNGYYYSLEIKSGKLTNEQFVYVLKSKSGMTTHIVVSIIKNNDFNIVKKDFNKIISTIQLK